MSLDKNIQIHNLKMILPNMPHNYLKVYTYLSVCLRTDDVTISDVKKALYITKEEVLEAVLYLLENRISNYNIDGDKIVIGEGIKPDVLAISTKQKQMFKMAEKLLGKMLSPNDVSILSGLHEMGLDAKIILFIIEYCVENGKYSPKYIEKVALSWFDMGIDTVDRARKYKNYLKEHKKFADEVRGVLDIYDRNLTAKEDKFVHKWKESYSFNVDIIELAYRYTIDNTSKRSFEYMDKILYSWYSVGVKSVRDAVSEKEKFDDKKQGKKNNVYIETGAECASKYNTVINKVWDFSKKTV